MSIDYQNSKQDDPAVKPATSTTEFIAPVNHTSTFPTTLADLDHHLPLVSSGTNKSIYSTLSALRKSTLSIPNRLTSVLQDANFVEALQHYLNDHCSSHQSKDAIWPLIPNERSGSWALDPALKLESQTSFLSQEPRNEKRVDVQPVSAYFKSTDGHVSQWSFSTRRLNLPVLQLLGHASSQGTGCVLIDTTRRGKSYPDALRRTVPIWSTVWNRVLFPEMVDSGYCDFQSFGLEGSETSQIESRIPQFAADLRALGLSLEDLRQKVKCPVRCVWVSQPGDKQHWEECFENLVQQIQSETWRSQQASGTNNINILICCSASKRVLGAEMSEDGYIQGAGDDSEGWSRGLTAKLFWDNKQVLMEAVHEGADLEQLVDDIVASSKVSQHVGHAILVAPTTNLFIATGSNEVSKQTRETFSIVIACNANVQQDDEKLLALGCKQGKLGSKVLREKLVQVKARCEQTLKKTPNAKVLVTCSTGRDLSVGVVLVLLCCFYHDQGTIDFFRFRSIDKQFIKQRLAWITSSKPDANPSRATLQAVNSFLMGRSD
ncbi:tRNA A64-2'-O-ribosylphosphate transferase [Lithohypha guttulata]|nr:tRNA A64-2'-O-ribosylphosphate transferase [Lithohypha guttulata]